jgi:hypothetical protein
MKITLPFDLIPYLDGTGIAGSFGLKNQYPENHTIIELRKREAGDLLRLLRALEEELALRQLRLQRQSSKAPLIAQRRIGADSRLKGVRRAVEVISAEIGSLGESPLP